MALLELRSLSKHYGGLQAVADLSLTVGEGEILGLIGPNGAGKTTVLNLVTAVERATSGEVYLDGTRIDGLSRHAIVRLGVARTYQLVRAFPSMTTLENVMVGCQPRIRASLLSAVLRTPVARREEREVRERALGLLASVGLQDKEALGCWTLTHAQRRLVELARALASEPRLLLLDEPAAGLNEQEVRDLLRLLRDLREVGHTLLIVEHNMRLVMDISDRIVVMNEGRKLAEGRPREVQRNPEVVRAYLGGESLHATGA